jgi:uncharacterized protein YegL
MREHPFYLLLDVSGSMHGESIHELQDGLSVLKSTFCQRLDALEIAYLVLSPSVLLPSESYR